MQGDQWNADRNARAAQGGASWNRQQQMENLRAQRRGAFNRGGASWRGAQGDAQAAWMGSAAALRRGQ